MSTETTTKTTKTAIDLSAINDPIGANLPSVPAPPQSQQLQSLSLWARWLEIQNSPDPYRMDWFEKKLKNLLDAAKGTAMSFTLFISAVATQQLAARTTSPNLAHLSLVIVAAAIAMQLVVTFFWASTWRWKKARLASYVVSIGVFLAAILVGGAAHL